MRPKAYFLTFICCLAFVATIKAQDETAGNNNHQGTLTKNMTEIRRARLENALKVAKERDGLAKKKGQELEKTVHSHEMRAQTAAGNEQEKSTERRSSINGRTALTPEKIQEIDRKKKEARARHAKTGNEQRQSTRKEVKRISLTPEEIQEIDRRKQEYRAKTGMQQRRNLQRMALTPEQIQEIDRKKAAARARNSALKGSDLTTRKKEQLLYSHLQRVNGDKDKCPKGNESEECKKFRAVYDSDGDGIVSKHELRANSETFINGLIKTSLQRAHYEEVHRPRRLPQKQPTEQ